MRNSKSFFHAALLLVILTTMTGCQEQLGTPSSTIAEVIYPMPLSETDVPTLASSTPSIRTIATPELTTRPSLTPVLIQPSPIAMPTTQQSSTLADRITTAANTILPTASLTSFRIEGIGLSEQGRPILSYVFGSGDLDLVLVGGIHGGYEWNTSLLAYRFIDLFRERPTRVPSQVTLHIIPVANPDGLYAITGKEGEFSPNDVIANTIPGRFNAKGVDLNRNWDCEWSANGIWRSRSVSGGSSPFSESETAALRDYFLGLDPVVVVFWHSAADGVYVSGCPDPHEPSYALARIYGEAADYPVYLSFDHYSVTGDAGDWLATQDIPSFTVELEAHESLDWEWNASGVFELLDYFENLEINEQEP